MLDVTLAVNGMEALAMLMIWNCNVQVLIGLQTLVSTCTEFGRKYGVTYYSIKSMCIAFCKGKARNIEEMPRLYLEGQIGC